MHRLIFEDLFKNFYIVYLNGKLIVTNKFYRAFNTPPPPKETEVSIAKISTVKSLELMSPGLPSSVKSNLSLAEPKIETSPMRKFISDAEVPGKQPTQTGYYWLNKYGKEAELELIKILSSGYQYDILVASTKLYYKSGGYPKTVSNYLTEGLWKSGYEDLSISLENGNSEQYIKKAMDNGTDKDGNTRYKR